MMYDLKKNKLIKNGHEFKTLTGKVYKRDVLSLLVIFSVEVKKPRTGALTRLYDHWIGLSPQNRIGIVEPTSDAMINWMKKTGFKAIAKMNIKELPMYIHPASAEEIIWMMEINNAMAEIDNTIKESI